MKAALIAAGEGSRLKAEGVNVSKPLVRINGTTLLERILLTAHRAGAEELCAIINEEMTDVREYLMQSSLPLPVRLIVKSTPSSMHSLHELSPMLREAPFYLTTVDSIFPDAEFDEYIRFARSQRSCDGVLAVTRYIDDEKPLCVALDERRRITAFSDTQEGYEWATGGIYYFSPRIFDELPNLIDAGMHRLRNFLRHLAAGGYTLYGYPFSTIIDVDHASDIAAAEAFLAREAAAGGRR